MVLGGVGDYFEVADTIIQMVRYEPFDVTVAAKRIARESPGKRRQEHQEAPGPAGIRVLQTDSIDPLEPPYDEYFSKIDEIIERCAGGPTDTDRLRIRAASANPLLK